MSKRSRLLVLVTLAGVLVSGRPASAAGPVSFTLKYGVLAGLTGDPAPSGQAWNESARLAVDYLANTLTKLGRAAVKVVPAASQDRQGSPQGGGGAAPKL